MVCSVSKKVVQLAHVQRDQSDCIIRGISLYAYMCRCITQHDSISSAEHDLLEQLCCYLGTSSLSICLYFKGQKLKSGINTICFITRLDYYAGYRKVFCCSALLWSFHECGTEILTDYPTLKQVTSCCSQQFILLSHDFVVTKTAMKSFAQYLQHDHTSKQDQSGLIQFELTCSVNANRSSPNRPRLGRQSLVV